MTVAPSMYAPLAPVAAATHLQAEWQVNNFDLVRLLAALQVAVVHGVLYLWPAGQESLLAQSGLSLFPGVPIFFVVSGVLVSRSYEHARSTREYYRNRCLRIFPALWVCLLVSLGLLCTVGLQALQVASTGDWLLWWAAQMSLFQSYSPAFLGSWGGTGLNPSLWTIPVELEFYLALPLLYRLMRCGGRWAQPALIALMVLSYAIEVALVHAAASPSGAQYALVRMTIAPYLWMFLLGVLVQRNWSALRVWFVDRAHWWLLGYLLLCVLAKVMNVRRGGDDIKPLFMLPLAGLVVATAMSARGWADKLLRHRDVSYGLYIYHMPVIAVLSAMALRSVGVAVALSVAVAILSWVAVEKPFLAHKRRTLRTVT